MDEQNILFIAALALFSGLLLLLTVRAVNVTRYFCRRTFFLVGKLREPGNDESFAYWRKELRCHYLTLIPFVTKRNVGSIYQLFFYKARYAKPRERFDGLNHLMAPSLLTICACTFCLCGMSWAWFSASTSSNISQINSATFSVKVDQQIDSDSFAQGLGMNEDGRSYTIDTEEGKTYTITITPTGTASKGYCVITLYNTAYYTDYIQNGGTFTFKFTGQSGVELSICPLWGSYKPECKNVIQNNAEIGTSSSTSS